MADPIGTFMQDEKARRASVAAGALDTGASAGSPDDMAAALDLGGQIGAAPISLMRQPAGVQRHLTNLRNKTALSEAPKTAWWLAEAPEHATVVADEVENLSAFERWQKLRGSSEPTKETEGFFGMAGRAAVEGIDVAGAAASNARAAWAANSVSNQLSTIAAMDAFASLPPDADDATLQAQIDVMLQGDAGLSPARLQGAKRRWLVSSPEERQRLKQDIMNGLVEDQVFVSQMTNLAEEYMAQ